MSNLFEHNGNRFTYSIEADEDHGAPWENEDGHGDVSEWTGRDKAPGELVLSRDRRSRRFYDYAAACKTARADGWGFIPGDLETFQDEAGKWHSKVAARYMKAACFEAVADDINAAIRETYALHRATFPSARAYAAASAMHDFNRLKAWCDDQWGYVGVVVHMVDDEGDKVEGYSASLWGIESDCESYHEEVARELADEVASQLESELAPA